jgi:hypothetical protein
MPGQLDALPGGEIGENLFSGLGDLFLDACNLLVEINAQAVGLPVFGQFLELALQLGNGLLEIELMFHGVRSLGPLAGAGNAENCAGRAWAWIAETVEAWGSSGDFLAGLGLTGSSISGERAVSAGGLTRINLRLIFK